MNKNRAFLLMMLLPLAALRCIDLPEVDAGEPEPPGSGDPMPDAGLPDAGPPDAGPPDADNTLCGDGKIDGEHGEVCDDRNTTPGDGCSADCRSNETCGNGIRDIAKSEACDDGNTITEVSCPYGMASCIRCNSTCTQELTLAGYYCGDGISNAPHEACDDGNTITEAECSYGMLSCGHCDATCSRELDLSGPYCGDNVRNGPEACDDGNVTTETTCSYGTPACAACDSSCAQSLSLVGPYCGDGIKNGPEACDDGNASVCGTCSAACTQIQFSRATGSIAAVAPGDFRDAETFSLNDGTNPVVIFEFDKNGQITASHIRIDLSGLVLDEDVANEIIAVINGIGASLQITAEVMPGLSHEVLLSHDVEGTSGNRPISETVLNSFFKVSGMAGGAGRDCATGTGCTQDVDCQPGLVCKATKTCDLP